MLALTSAFGLLLAGCPESDDDDDDTTTPEVDEPIVTVSGNHGVAVAETISLSASTADGTDASYNWSIGDEGIATVDADGVVTGVGAGETTVTATGDDTDAMGDHAVVVIELGEGESVVLVSGDLSVGEGETAELTAETVNGEDSSYTWVSDDEDVATVDEDGVVSGVGAGEVIITATGADTAVSGDHGMVVTSEGFDTPYYDDWAGSGHADATAEAFNHWNEDDPLEIPSYCAQCHSTPGYLDFLGEDGTDAGTVDNAAAIGTVIECGACHNASAMALDAITFPSDVEVTGLGSEARCIACHSGRESSDDVDSDIADAEIVDEDIADEDLGFLNIHYFAAGATQYGGIGRGGYQYEGQTYDVRFRHAGGLETCLDCHDQHTLEVRVDQCVTCHAGVTVAEDAQDIRMMASLTTDYDGDGDLTEGIPGEIETLAETVMTAIQAYTGDVGIDGICYDSHTYPYWFIDTDASGGVCDGTEADYANQYASWTARLLKAAYNYQVAQKDPGAYAHNGKYLIQLLHDSIADVNGVLTTPIDMSSAVRDDPGHFAGANDAARHWDDDGGVSSSCAPCHAGSEGFEFYLEHGVGAEVEVGNGLQCETCHSSAETWDLLEVESVTFPSDIELELTGDSTNICGTCHAGRESKADIDESLESGSPSFQNVHYLPAAAIQQGTDAQVGYEYDGQTYAGPSEHPAGTECSYCHDPVVTEHTFDVNDNLASCTTCHPGVAEATEIRYLSNTTDYDGDGDSTETPGGELETLADDMYAEMTLVSQALAAPICYDAHSYPYWFNDTDGSGVCDGSEASYSNSYSGWTDQVLKAAFNYQVYQKEPGAWAHNFDYMAQLMIDTIDDLGGDVSAYTRP